MAGLTNDINPIQYGTGNTKQPVAYPVGASVQLYSGTVALISGSGATSTGFLKNAATTGTSDEVVGMLLEPAGGTFVQTGSGVLNGTVDGAIWMNVTTGAFFFQSGSGSDQLTAATSGKTVYYGGENASGPIACAVIGSPARPVLGVQIPQDPGIAGGFAPGAGYWPIQVRPDLGSP